MPKFIFVTGGVLSSLGKGTFTSSLAKLLKSSGVNVNAMKIDPYLNCDAGTLNPYEHGEVFVTRDGFECDLDLGTYERFLDVYARKEQNLMMGSAYKAVVEKERRGEFLGKTMQLIPHVTNEIKARIRKAAEATGCEALVVEVGGTVGDLESEVVLEAAREMKYENPKGVLFVHLALVPTITTGEQKSKPMQHSVRALLERGISPDVIVARSEKELAQGVREKIALFCNVREEDIISFPNVSTVYELPLILKEQDGARTIGKKLGLKVKKNTLGDWRKLVDKLKKLKRERKIGVVGKYVTTRDAYMSVFEAITHAGLANNVKPVATLVDSEEVEKGKVDLKAYDGFLVPGGFGTRGSEGKIKAIKFARENKVPLLGICFGFQLAVVEYARNVLDWRDANTTEIDPGTKHPVIDLLSEQKEVTEKGGTMRLGASPVAVEEGTRAFGLYGEKEVMKRHRHRYEVWPEAIKDLEGAGMKFSGKTPDGRRMEILELKDAPLMGSQFHPEFDSRLGKPEPLFNWLLKATV
jgi:CTP synthase